MPVMSKELVRCRLTGRHLSHKIFGYLLCVAADQYHAVCGSGGYALFLVLTSSRDFTLDVIDAKPASMAFLSTVNWKGGVSETHPILLMRQVEPVSSSVPNRPDSP
jgi:hypothetical protein